MSIDERLRRGLAANADVPSPPVDLLLRGVEQQHRTRTFGRALGAVAAVVVVLLAAAWVAVGGTDDGRVTPAPPGPSSSAPAPTPEPVPAGTRHPVPGPLHGTWLVDLGRAQLRHDLAQAGFGAYADRFLRRERLGPRATLAVTYDADAFHVYWRQPDGGWFDGWHGVARERDGVLTMADTQSGDDTSYTWQVDGEQLWLRFRSTTTPDQGSIPFEAYSAAYFSRPLVRIDCVAGNLDSCV